jgi:phosphohistidine swiveling domain-containing protein
MDATMTLRDEPSAAPPAAPLALRDAIDATRCGHKAATLAALRNAGHNVPDGFVIPVDGTRDPAAVGAALAALGPGRYAVRSSGLAEDLAEASFAGQYDSILGARDLDEVLRAIERVRASGHSERATAYREHGHLDDAPLGVLVQRQIEADAAGVMFSHNPVTGDDEVVIEAVRGLGDRLLEGEQSGDRWIGRGTAALAAVDTGVLDVAMVQRLVALARRLARERGGPQDIEWAVRDGEIHLLQARPIAALPRRPEITFPPGRWTKDCSHFTGPMSAMGASIILPAYEAAMEPVFAEFGIPMKTIHQRAFGGEVYTQEIDLSGKNDTSAPPPWWLLAVLVRLVPSVRRRLKAAERGLGLLDEYPRRWEETWRDECWARLEAARAVDPATLTDDALLRELDRLVDEILVPHLTIHFQLTVPHTVGVFDLKRACADLLGWDTAQTLTLLTGSSTATTAATRELANVAAALDEDVLAAGMDALRKSPAWASLAAWLQRWGLRTIDADPGSTMIAERDDLILGLLRRARSAPRGDGLAEQERKRQAAIAAARRELAGADLARFDAALAYAERVYGQRDDNVELTEGLPAGLIRRVLLEIGARLERAGILAARGDVAHLQRSELAPALRGTLEGESALARARRRRAERAWVLAHPGPVVVGPAPVAPPDMRGLPAAARRIMDAMMFGIAEELAPPQPKTSDDGAIVGVGVSPGSYTGPVRIVGSEVDLERLRPGDVLVCPTTHSSWTVVFGHAGALVTDGGGMLSHPAIIAREHGIPAVVATGVATTHLRDGELVRVDGSTGRVERV